MLGVYLLWATANMAYWSYSFSSEKSAIGIIGGADGPTAIYVAHTVNYAGIAALIIAAVLLIALVIWYFIKRGKRREAH